MFASTEKLVSLQQFYANHIAGKRLLLPTIQRGLIWDNQRMINYWDSLNRGWFPGIFMVRKLNHDEYAYDMSGQTTIQVKAADGDLEIFDGQQRMSTIMLGFGLGRLARSYKMWVGFLKDKNEGKQEILFRITTLGQPFGYRIENPNEKFSAGMRREMFTEYTKHLNLTVQSDLSQFDVNKRAFDSDCSQFLLGDNNYEWFPLAKVLKTEVNHDKYDFKNFRKKIENTEIFLHSVTESEFADYEEFFRRVGQGGVRLTDDELTYALMNRLFPVLRPLIEKMLDNPSIGYLSSPTDLALGLFRLAMITTSNSDTSDSDSDTPVWERANRPDPRFIRRIATCHSSKSEKNKSLPRIKETFDEWTCNPDDENSIPVTLLKDVRKLLQYREGKTASPILISKIDRYVIDIAMMLCRHQAFDKTSTNIRGAFCYWAMFFSKKTKKVANQLAQKLSSSKEIECRDDGYGDVLLKEVISTINDEGRAMAVPSKQDLRIISERIREADKLIPVAEWFSAADERNGRRPSDFFSQMCFWTPKGKNLLLWMQSDYLNKHYPDFDPTSDRDEFLPVDLDHIIPSSRFEFRWSEKEAALWLDKLGTEDQLEIFHDNRKSLGNLIGNLRWLDASVNRSRGDGGDVNDNRLDDETIDTDHREQFQYLKSKFSQSDLSGWDATDLLKWQRTVLLRTVDLVEASLKSWSFTELFG